MNHIKENRGACGVDGGENRAGEQKAGNLILHDGPGEQETTLGGRAEPLAQAAADAGACG